MEIIVSNNAEIIDPPEALAGEIRRRLTFDNPKYLDAEKMGRWTGEIEPDLRCYQNTAAGLAVPRGFCRQLVFACRRHGVKIDITDRRRTLAEAGFNFLGALKPFQAEAAEAMLAKDFGTLSAPTGSGKTVIALSIIAERRQPALIVVHTKELAFQWIDRIEQFLGIPAEEIGLIGAGKKTLGDRITVALVQSLYKCSREVAPYIGNLIVDECHRTPSRTFTEAVGAFDSKYMLGLSATPWRRDKLSKLIFFYLGDVQHEVDRGRLQERGDILSAEVITRETDFRPYSDPSTEYSAMLSELTQDAGRNRQICEDIAEEAESGAGTILALSDRKEHVQALHSILKAEHGIEAATLTGDMGKQARAQTVEALNAGRVRVLIATGQLIGEGFDCRGLSTLFLATPIRFSGRVLQYLGRVLRPAPGKDKARVFDYVDVHVGPLIASARARGRVLEAA